MCTEYQTVLVNPQMRDKFDGYVSALASGTGPRPAQASPRSVDAASRRQNNHKRRDWPFESIRRDFKKWRPDTRRSTICVIVKGQNERTHTKVGVQHATTPFSRILVGGM